MGTQDRIYFAQRAAEEQELAQAAANPEVAEVVAKAKFTSTIPRLRPQCLPNMRALNRTHPLPIHY